MRGRVEGLLSSDQPRHHEEAAHRVSGNALNTHPGARERMPSMPLEKHSDSMQHPWATASQQQRTIAAGPCRADAIH